jgi:3-oxoacyl-[acyl-carrier-protein] synthase-1
LGTVTNIISESLGAPEYVNTISTACSSSANSIMLAARMIESGTIDRVIAGGSDALSRFTINGFRSLMIYDSEKCRPFDKNRRGLNLGEGAGYLLLENEASLEQSMNSALAKITGWHNANDAYHQTGTSPEGDGAMKAMQGALETTSLSADSRDYVNAHGTATPNNDQSESNALKRIFKEKKINYSSTKGFTGHTLGASGGIEAVFSVLAVKNQCYLPNIGLQQEMEEAPNLPVTNFKQQVPVSNVMSNSFGFGGNSTSLIFSKA